MKTPIASWGRKKILAGTLAAFLAASAVGLLATGGGERPEATSTSGGSTAGPCPPAYIGNYPDDLDTAWGEDVQGIAHDDDHWFVTQTQRLWSFPVDFDLGTTFSLLVIPPGVVLREMPPSLTAAGFNHYGDLDQFGGYLFVPLEGTGEGIAAFTASDLNLVSWTAIDQGGAAAWLALRQEGEAVLLYSSPGTLSKDDPLYRYSLDMATFESTQDLAASLAPAPAVQPGADLGRFWLNESDGEPLRRSFRTTQGGVFDSQGDFYLINGAHNEDVSDQRGGIHMFNARGRLVVESTVEAGDRNFRYEYHPNFATWEEPEGIDWWDNPPAPRISGQLHAFLLDNDVLSADEVYLKHYTVTDTCPTPADLRVTNLCQPHDETTVAQEVVTCTVTVDNLGPGVPFSAKVLDTLRSHAAPGEVFIDFSPEAMLVAEGTVTTFPLDCPAVGGGIKQYECDVGMVPVNGRASYSVRYWSGVTADFDHEVWAFSGLPDPDSTNNYAVDGQSFRAFSDLYVLRILESADPVVAGTTLAYEVIVWKPLTGPNVFTVTNNVVLSISLSPGVSILSATHTGSPFYTSCDIGVPGDPSAPTRCPLGTMVPETDKRANLEVAVLPDTRGPILIAASVTSDSNDLNPQNNLATESTAVIAEADLEVQARTTQTSVLSGTTMTQELTVVNHGPSAAQGVELRARLHPGVRFERATISDGGTCTYIANPVHELACMLGELSPNAESPITVQFDVLVQSNLDDAATITTIVDVSSTTPDPSPANDESTISTTVRAEADLEVRIAASCLVCDPSVPIVYTVTVVNHGPSDARDVVVVDTLPLSPDTNKVRYLFDTAGCTVDAANVLTCTLGTIKAGESATFDIFIETSGRLGVITDRAQVSSSTFDPDLATNTAAKTVVVT